MGDIRQNIDCTCSGQVYRFDTDLSLSLEEVSSYILNEAWIIHVHVAIGKICQ